MMLRRLALAALLAFTPAIASAQMALIAPTPPTGANNDQIATTGWVYNLFAAGVPLSLASGKIYVGSAGGIATAQTMSGDATLSIAGALSFSTVNANVGSFGSATQCLVLTTNAKGLITAASTVTCAPALGSITGLGAGVATAAALATNAAGGLVTSPVANSNLANSTISGIALGANLNALTFGTHLASGGTSYNGVAGVTITSDATAVNTASTIMARDGSGQVAATTFTGALVGNASTATNASTVTTNANLTGPITSTGNATAIASQTGTGTKFVVDTSPTIVTPNLTTGFSIGGLAASGNYARGNGTNFVSSAIQAGDLPLATTGAFGAVKPDGSTITVSGGVITASGGSATTVTVGTTTVTGGPGILANSASGGALKAFVPASVHIAPASPTATSSASITAMGLGTSCVITPTLTGRVRFDITGDFSNNGAGGQTGFRAYYGTGTAPANGAAISGIQFGNAHVITSPTAGASSTSAIFDIEVSLTPGTPYWFDAAINAGSGTSTMTNPFCMAKEY